MNLVLFVNGAVKPYVDWLENRKMYGTSQEKYRRRGSAVLHTGPHAMQSNPYSGLFYRRVILTLKFIPHERISLCAWPCMHPLCLVLCLIWKSKSTIISRM